MTTARRLAPLVALVACLAAAPTARATFWRPFELERLNRRLCGKVEDFTNRHDGDRRICSAALGEKRDLYVYLPPNFDCRKRYSVVFWLHGYSQDEHKFVESVVCHLDRAIARGQVPPCIIVAPDGSVTGRPCLYNPGSFFLNTKAGRFEDFLMQDVWDFVHQRYPIRPERDAHILAGVSMGGGSAFNLGIKYRDRVRTVVGLFPPLNTRWMDCHGDYFANFDPNCWGWRTDTRRGHEVVGVFYGVVPVKLKQLLDPLYNRRDPMTLEELSRENPIEMLDRLDLKDGELEMYIGYGDKDQFNIDAQAESFIYRACQKGLTLKVNKVIGGRHDLDTALKLFPYALDWLCPRVPPPADAAEGPQLAPTIPTTSSP